MPLVLARLPRTLSFGSTCCLPSGTRPSSLCPMLAHWLPLHAISTPLFGGPTAWEAALALVMVTGTCVSWPLTSCHTAAPAVPGPNGSTPLNVLLARPSQKLRKLNTASTTEGVLRPVTWRTLTPPTLNVASATCRQAKAVGSLGSSIGGAGKLFLKTPCE